MAVVTSLAVPSLTTTAARPRFVLFPIQYPELWTAYKLAQSSFWTADEVELGADREDWRALLTEDERRFFSFILGFFAAADGIVADNLVQRFCAEVDVPEVRCFYGFQIAIENVHAEVYSRLVLELVDGVASQETLFRAIENAPPVRAKAEWCVQWISTDAPLLQRVVAFAIVEGVFFSSSFAAVFWLRERGIMPGMTFSNELIARDEGQHVAFACMLYHRLGSRVDRAHVCEMLEGAVLLEKQFFEVALPMALPGLTFNMMSTYIEYVGDCLLRQLGYGVLFNADNPFPFMTCSAIDTRSNFFERSVSNYHGATGVQP